MEDIMATKVKFKDTAIILPIELTWSEAKTIEFALEDRMSKGLIPFAITEKLKAYFEEFDKIEKELQEKK